MRMTLTPAGTANVLFFCSLMAVLIMPHMLQVPLTTEYEAAAARPERNWAREPLSEFKAPEDVGEILRGDYARYLDDQVKETVFSRYTTALGNEMLYGLFGTFRRPFIRGEDGWIFWDSAIEYVVGTEDQDLYVNRLERLQLVQELTTICFASRGVHCIFAPIPKKASVSSEHLPRGLQLRRERGFSDPVWDEVIDRCRKQGSDVIDLRPRMREMYLAGDLPYFKLDTHLSPNGMTETAKMIAEEVRRSVPEFANRHGSPDGVVSRSIRLTTDATHRMGFRDANQFDGDFRFAVDLNEYPTARVEGGSQTEIALAGTSFAERFSSRMKMKGNLARALSWELDAIVLDHAIQAGGPTKGLIMVVKEAPSMPNLKVVVSEFPFRLTFSTHWDLLAKALVETPWTRAVLADHFASRPEEKARVAKIFRIKL